MRIIWSRFRLALLFDQFDFVGGQFVQAVDGLIDLTVDDRNLSVQRGSMVVGRHRRLFGVQLESLIHEARESVFFGRNRGIQSDGKSFEILPKKT